MVDVKTGALGKHTPGKWQAVKMAQQIGCAEWCVQYGDDGEHIADVVYEEADAHLIAAAPELLAALEESVREIGYTLPSDYVKRYESALKKARGK